MARPLRIESPGAVYHVTSRGDRREDIFVDDEDRQGLLAVVAQAFSRFDAQALAYCLMGNHYLCEASHKMCYVKFKIMWSGEGNESYPVDISLIVCPDLAYCFT